MTPFADLHFGLPKKITMQYNIKILSETTSDISRFLFTTTYRLLINGQEYHYVYTKIEGPDPKDGKLVEDHLWLVGEGGIILNDDGYREINVDYLKEHVRKFLNK